MLKPKTLNDGEIDLLNVIEDPILLVEFLKNTNGGSLDRKTWPKKPYELIYYQKDLATDQHPYILITGGRSIGKCHPRWGRVYVYPYGYVTILELQRRNIQGKSPHFIVYALNDKKEIVQARARLTYNKIEPVFRVKTQSGYVFDASGEHPLLTPDGYIPISELFVGATVAVASKLPHDSNLNSMLWHELRWLGYAFGARRASAEMELPLKYKAHKAEMEVIAERAGCNLFFNNNNTVIIKRKKGPLKHPMHSLLSDHSSYRSKTVGTERVPLKLKEQRLENIKVFLESFLSMYANFHDGKTIDFSVYYSRMAQDLQELFLRFGVEFSIEQRGKMEFFLQTRDYAACYKLSRAFAIPGVRLELSPPDAMEMGHMRYDAITSIDELPPTQTYAITVTEWENYISENLYVHNSECLAAIETWEMMNPHLAFEDVDESMLMTPSQLHRDELLGKIMGDTIRPSRLLRAFIEKDSSSKTEPVFEFYRDEGKVSKMRARIEGSDFEKNQVALHVENMTVDEGQAYSIAAYTHLRPSLNDWSSKAKMIVCGVHNNSKEGLLYHLARRRRAFKHYIIPSPNNFARYSLAKFKEDISEHGGTNETSFKNMVLGILGPDQFSPIPPDKIRIEEFPFYTAKFNAARPNVKENGEMETYTEALKLIDMPENDGVLLAMDCGFTDPSIIQVMTYHKADQRYRVRVRYRLEGIEALNQVKILDYLLRFYNPYLLAMDYGNGGQGATIGQGLMSRDLVGSRYRDYAKIIKGFTWSPISRGTDHVTGKDLRASTKSIAGDILVSMVTASRVVLSQLDQEGLSQLVRVAYNRKVDGSNEYYIASKNGKGKSTDDHTFASFLVFALALDSVPKRTTNSGFKAFSLKIAG